MSLSEVTGAAPYKSQFSLEDFELYRGGREFRKKVYQLIRQLPPDERYCLDKQMRRAAISVTNNIAEGHGRWHFRENIQFCQHRAVRLRSLLTTSIRVKTNDTGTPSSWPN